ncbi:cysteine hydrolase family protein [Caulobacter segnis]|uniref:cysteine hydrolase family protein n=1 Tax=Caulobacter segnis TaxID=88688 RepID=UPI002410629D|nr:cysteine hydrolase family protein [Caulobacter segnis]MDG2522847.1 cysteine hydrolase family protein [Caulobacter segnis]
MSLLSQFGGFTAAILAASLSFAAAQAAGPVLMPDGRPATLRDLRPGERPAIDPKRAALLIIDAQNEYVDGKLPLEGFDPAVVQIQALRAWAHENGALVIHIRQIAGPTSPIFAAGGHGAEIIAQLTPTTDELVIDKALPNSFHATALQKALKAAGKDQLIVTGFMAHMCVDATTRAGFDLGYQNYVVASATADRALPDPLGGVVTAAEVKRVALTALNDRFAWVLKDAAEVKASAK